MKAVSTPAMIFSSVGLARAVEAEDADLGAGKEREPDVFENLGVGRINLPEPLHGVNELRHELTIIVRDQGAGNGGNPQLIGIPASEECTRPLTLFGFQRDQGVAVRRESIS